MSAVPWLLGLRNPPRPLLVAGPSSTGSSDSDGGLFAVPTTLPPNSRHGKLYSPSKDTELTFRQHLNSISVSGGGATRPAGGACIWGRTLTPTPSPYRCSRISSCRSPGSCGTGTCGSHWWSRSGRPRACVRQGDPCPSFLLTLRTDRVVTGPRLFPEIKILLHSMKTACKKDRKCWGFKSHVSRVRIYSRTLGAPIYTSVASRGSRQGRWSGQSPDCPEPTAGKAGGPWKLCADPRAQPEREARECG